MPVFSNFVRHGIGFFLKKKVCRYGIGFWTFFFSKKKNEEKFSGIRFFDKNSSKFLIFPGTRRNLTLPMFLPVLTIFFQILLLFCQFLERLFYCIFSNKQLKNFWSSKSIATKGIFHRLNGGVFSRFSKKNFRYPFFLKKIIFYFLFLLFYFIIIWNNKYINKYYIKKYYGNLKIPSKHDFQEFCTFLCATTKKII